MGVWNDQWVLFFCRQVSRRKTTSDTKQTIFIKNWIELLKFVSLGACLSVLKTFQFFLEGIVLDRTNDHSFGL